MYKHVSSHVINYQHVSSAFAIIIEVALQEYNNLPHEISGITQCYMPQTVSISSYTLLQLTLFLVLL
jgi:hypothetical protein